MVTLEALSVQVELFSLIGGNVSVSSIGLESPVIVLETDADGRANWVFETATLGDDAATTAPADQASDASASVAIDEATIRNGTVIYRDGVSGAEHRLEGIDTEITMGGLQGPFDVSGSLTYQGLPISLDGSIGALDAGRAAPIRLEVAAEDAGTSLTVSGALDLDGGPSFTGDFGASIDEISRLPRILAVAGGDAAALPAGLSGPVSLQTTVTGSPEAVALDNYLFRSARRGCKGRSLWIWPTAWT